MEQEKKLLETYRKYSEKIKEEGEYEHNYFLADLLVLFREQEELRPEEIRSIWENSSPGDRSLYIHVPFCIRKCRYCIYASEKPENQDMVREYTENTIRELEYYSDAVEGKFDTFYMGGGTPSILSAESIEKLLETVNSNYSFRKGSERTFEMNPSTATEEKIEILSEQGINRVSFGVQSSDREILENENRGYQSFEMVEKAVKKALETGFEEVNVDLIAGLEGSEKEDIIRSFRDIADLGPDRICIYPLQPNSSYLEKRGQTQKEFFKQLENLLEELRKPLKEEARKQGYHSPDLTVNPRDANSWGFRKEGSRTGFVKSYRFSGQDIDGCLGIGPQSNSYIRNRIDYKRMNIQKFRKDRKLYRGLPLERKDSMRSFILNRAASEMELSKEKFRERFGTGIEEEFGKALEMMERAGAIKDNGDIIEIVDRDPKDIFAGFFFLFEERDILESIKEHSTGKRWYELGERAERLLN